jgi:hypothetical protein
MSPALGVLVLLLALVISQPHPATALGEPRIRVAPDPVISGEQMVVIGEGFCGDADCPPMVIFLAGEAIAEGVDVRMDGSFEVTLDALIDLGTHSISAHQDVDGRTLIASTEFTVVPTGDIPTQVTTPRQTGVSGDGEATSPTASSTPDPSSGKSTMTPSSTAAADEDVQNGGGGSSLGWILLTVFIASAACIGASMIFLRRVM